MPFQGDRFAPGHEHRTHTEAAAHQQHHGDEADGVRGTPGLGLERRHRRNHGGLAHRREAGRRTWTRRSLPPQGSQGLLGTPEAISRFPGQAALQPRAAMRSQMTGGVSPVELLAIQEVVGVTARPQGQCRDADAVEVGSRLGVARDLLRRLVAQGPSGHGVLEGPVDSLGSQVEVDDHELAVGPLDDIGGLEIPVDHRRAEAVEPAHHTQQVADEVVHLGLLETTGSRKFVEALALDPLRDQVQPPHHAVLFDEALDEALYLGVVQLLEDAGLGGRIIALHGCKESLDHDPLAGAGVPCEPGLAPSPRRQRTLDVVAVVKKHGAGSAETPFYQYRRSSPHRHGAPVHLVDLVEPRFSKKSHGLVLTQTIFQPSHPQGLHHHTRKVSTASHPGSSHRQPRRASKALRSAPRGPLHAV